MKGFFPAPLRRSTANEQGDEQGEQPKRGEDGPARRARRGGGEKRQGGPRPQRRDQRQARGDENQMPSVLVHGAILPCALAAPQD